MSHLHLVRDGETPANRLQERWEAVKAAGDQAVAEGRLVGLFVLLDDGAHVAGEDAVALCWAAKRAAEGALDQMLLGDE